MIPQTVEVSQNIETPIDENFESVEHMFVYAKDPRYTENLDWAYYGGRWAGFAVVGTHTTPANKLTLTDNATNYIVVALVDGAISVSTAITNWNNTGQYRRVYKVPTSGGQVTIASVEDHRAGPGGIHAGIAKPEPIVNRVITGSDNLVIGDAENTVVYDSASAGNLTIPTNATVAFPVGTSIALLQDNTGQLTVVAAGGVTLNVEASLTAKMAARYAMAMLYKRDTDRWILSGSLEKV